MIIMPVHNLFFQSSPWCPEIAIVLDVPSPI